MVLGLLLADERCELTRFFQNSCCVTPVRVIILQQHSDEAWGKFIWLSRKNVTEAWLFIVTSDHTSLLVKFFRDQLYDLFLKLLWS